MVNLITAQEYLDNAIVNQKLNDADFDVFVSPAFIHEGQEYQVILDGHHSFAAAKLAGIEPNFIVQNVKENDTIGLLLDGNTSDFLEVNQDAGNEYRFAETNKAVW